MRKIVAFIFYLLFAAPCLLPGQENLEVVMLGNSLVKEGQWENRFGENIHVDIASVIDFTSKQMSWILNWAVYPKDPEICIIMGAQEDFYLFGSMGSSFSGRCHRGSTSGKE